MVDMIDCAVAFLGPDLDPLEEQLITLRKRHVKYGVKPQYLSVMGQSVLFVLQQMQLNLELSNQLKILDLIM